MLATNITMLLCHLLTGVNEAMFKWQQGLGLLLDAVCESRGLGTPPAPYSCGPACTTCG